MVTTARGWNFRMEKILQPLVSLIEAEQKFVSIGGSEAGDSGSPQGGEGFAIAQPGKLRLQVEEGIVRAMRQTLDVGIQSRRTGWLIEQELEQSGRIGAVQQSSLRIELLWFLR